jgi:hypothetical protein
VSFYLMLKRAVLKSSVDPSDLVLVNMCSERNSLTRVRVRESLP